MPVAQHRLQFPVEPSNPLRCDRPVENLVERSGPGPDYWADRKLVALSPESLGAELVCKLGLAGDLRVLVEHCHTAVRLVVGSQDYFEAGNQDCSEDSHLVRLEEDSRPKLMES